MEKRKSMLNRRSLVKILGMGAASGTLGIIGVSDADARPLEDPQVQKDIDADPIKITKIESVRFNENLSIGGGSGGSGKTEFCWVRLHTNKGIIGTGETYPFSNGELGALKDYTRFAYHIPTTPHTCGGPLLWLASIHMCTAIPNFSYMESNYWKYTHQYPHFLNNVPVPVDGYVTVPEKPGLGAEIRPEIFENGDAIVETLATL